MKNKETEDFNGISILLVVEGDIVTTHLVERLLVYCSKWGVKYRKVYIRDLCVKDLNCEDLPLFVRSADPQNVFFVECLLKVGKPYLYYLDDNFWALAGDSPLAQYYSHPSVRNALERIVRGAKCVIVNSNILAEVVRKYNKNVVILNAFFDFTLIDGLTQDFHQEIRVGFAGSTTRGGDFEVVIPAIHRIIEKYGNKVIFEFAGILPDGLIESERIRFFQTNHDYSDFVKWQYLRAWDIALAPLAPVESNLAKTNNKFREYGACSIAGIYSDYGPYPPNIEEGMTGLMVGWNEDEWYEAMCSLIENEEIRKKIGFSAYEDIKTNYSLSSVADQWFQVFNSIKTKDIDYSCISKKFFYLNVKHKIISRYQWFILYYKLNGFKRMSFRLFEKSLLKVFKGFRG